MEEAGKAAGGKPRKRTRLETMTLKGAAAHRFLRAIDPNFPEHPDETAARERREAREREAKA